jgi:uncharacterized lipoprotein YajG
MGGYLKRYSLLLMLLSLQPLFFITNGCGGKELTINYDPKGGVPEGYGINAPLNIAVITYDDKRTGIDSKRKVADISSVVMDVHSSELLLKEDVSALVTKALRDQLNHVGFKAEVVPGVTFDRSMLKAPLAVIPPNVDTIIGGEVKRFHLDVGKRDRIEIELNTFITSRKDGSLLWNGTTIHEGDRFAGVSGNTRGSIERYINSSLTTVIKKILRESEQALTALTKSQSPSPDLPPSTPPIKTSTLPPQKEENETTSNGTLIVTSTPPGARFYINDTFYGKTPVNIELKPGIYEITVRLRGFRDEKEKVAIRPGISTELEVFLENEKR